MIKTALQHQSSYALEGNADNIRVTEEKIPNTVLNNARCSCIHYIASAQTDAKRRRAQQKRGTWRQQYRGMELYFLVTARWVGRFILMSILKKK